MVCDWLIIYLSGTRKKSLRTAELGSIILVISRISLQSASGSEIRRDYKDKNYLL